MHKQQQVNGISPDMRLCKVVQKVGQCTSFELFDEATNEFLLACAMENSALGTLIFSTFRDCHLRKFDDIVFLLKGHVDFVATMSRDWMSGLKFILTDATNEAICEIR